MNMSKFDYDLMIIGSGSSGATAAMTAVGFGKKVLLIEKERLGGTCTNVGCVPSKSFLHDAELLRMAKTGEHEGLLKIYPEVNYAPVKSRKEKLVSVMRNSGAKVIDRAGIELKAGIADLANEHTVSLNGDRISADNIMIATGSSSFVPPIEGISEIPYLTSTEALELNQLPDSVIIIGGSYIGLEFANFFSSMGTKVTILEVADKIAANEDEAISSALTVELVNQGIEVHVGIKINFVTGDNAMIKVAIEKDGGKIIAEAEKILVATGRIPDIKNLNLDGVGIKFGRKGIEVNEYLQTAVKNIYAVGDVIPTLQLEHVAVYEGWLAAKNMYSEKKEPADYRVIPRVMFSNPEVASVGETETQAKQHSDTMSTSFPYNGIPKAQINEERAGLIKLVADANTGKLLGAHIIGKDAGELIHLAALAMQFNLRVSEIANGISAYPTLSQGFYNACDSLAEKL